MYIQYLQSLLKQNKLNYKSQAQFLQQAKTTQIQKEDQKAKVPPIPNNMKQPLTSKIVERYSRQMLLKEISYKGQLKLLNSKIAVIGAGGVGCPLALYLAAAGVGTLGLFDSDVVQITNLHRQIGHRTDRIGMEKTQSLKQTINRINPLTKINKHPFIKIQTVQALDDYDFVIDGSDNPGCRYMVNDYCMKTGKKLLSGACIGWEAQITTFGGQSLCYRCLWGNDQLSVGGCSTLGVVGMVPGLVGILLGIEAIKLIINGNSSLQGKLLTFDGRKCEFKKVSLRKKQANCLACGQNKLNMQTYDYSKYNQCAKPTFPEVKEITWNDFVKQKLDNLILDVRPSSLYNIVHLQNAVNIPNEILVNMSRQQVIEKLGADYENKEIAVSCVRGFTSKLAVKYLQSIGIKACSIKGGILGYRKQFDSNIPEL